MRVTTYNIRHGQGLDGRVSTQRIADVLKAIRPDVAGINEAWRVPGRFEQPKELATLT